MDLLIEEEGITSHAMLKKLLDPDLGKFKGCEGVLSVLVKALVAKGGVESVVESMVSVMEAHSSPLRGLTDQTRIEDEMQIAWNGEDIYHCDSVVKEALEAYLSKCKREGDREGHFIRRSSNIKSYVVSKAVDSKVNCPPKLPVMFKEK